MGHYSLLQRAGLVIKFGFIYTTSYEDDGRAEMGISLMTASRLGGGVFEALTMLLVIMMCW